jgi:Ca-activated chloride channel homolog
MKRNLLLLFVLIFWRVSFSDGLMMPSKEDYPKDFLRNRLTEVTVDIHGMVAETSVYQEFVNEWNDSTGAVYSFPLPPDARAVEFDYWYRDTVYRAVLKVKEQATNPGTGEGGVAALVNDYIGRNGIKIFLKTVDAGSIQKVKLRYISLCDFYQGKCTYNFPLNTEQFVTYPLENLQFNINVYSNTAISDFGMPSHPGFQVVENTGNELKLKMVQPKAYLNKDFEFFYSSDRSNLGVDFFSVDSDTMDGHFALFVRPQDKADKDSVIAKRIFFVVSNSSSMFGSKLSQSIAAVSQSLDQLSSKDYFNLIIYNYYPQSWLPSPVKATPENIESAKNYLSSISTSWGSQMDLAIKECLNEIKNDSLSNNILVFTNGRSPLDPKEIESLNNYKAGIFPVGIGEDIDRAKLEMTAALNYGFVTYLSEEDNISEKILRVFNLINQPVLTKVAMEFGRADLYSILPAKLPSTYAGSYFFITGRYKNPGLSVLNVGGVSVKGMTVYNFKLDFSNTKTDLKFVESLWAKESIDAIEREIEIYGETVKLKDSLITLSLRYGIRCRYTAYIADYQTYATSVDNFKNKIIAIPASYIAGNYPNPFNPSTRIRIFLDDNTAGKIMYLKIYNCLGQLVQVIDITNLQSGWNEIFFDGKDMYGRILPSGIYFVRLEVQNKIESTIKINLIK